MEIEKQRGISVATSVMSFEYKGTRVNLLDTPGHKDFAQSSEEGKIFLDTLQSTSSYTGTGMHHLILSVDDIPKGVSVLSDPRTTGSVSLKGSIPMQNLSIVQSMGSKIIPGANIDWKGVTFPK